jgi:hypothetical protein
LGEKINNHSFGRYVNLREVTIDTSNNKLEVPTRTICISEHLYRMFIAHSKKYYPNPESYEVILENLLSNYDEHHNKNEHWYNLDS